jgi:hypothetical protein
MNCRGLGGAGHATRMGKIRNEYKIFMEKSHGKLLIGRLR